MTELPAYGTPEADEVDWFGDGSAFDSGEDLAAALFGMSGTPEPEHVENGSGNNDETLDDPFEWGPGGVGASPPVVAHGAGSGGVPHPPAPSPSGGGRPTWAPEASPTPASAWPRAMPLAAAAAAAAEEQAPGTPPAVEWPPAPAGAAPGPPPREGDHGPVPPAWVVARSQDAAPAGTPPPDVSAPGPPAYRVGSGRAGASSASPPSPEPAGWGVRDPEYGGTGGRYGIRHGVRMLRIAEKTMDQLRVDAVQVAWAAAALAVAQARPDG